MSEQAPANVDLTLEQLVLGWFLQVPAAWALCAELPLSSACFWREAHRTLYAACGDVAEAGHPVEYPTISAYLRAAGTLDAVGGPVYLGRLCEGIPRPDADVARWAVDRLDKLRVARDTAAAATSLATRAGLTRDGYDGAALASELAAFERIVTQASTVTALDSEGQIAALFAEHQREQAAALRIGFPYLDDALGGMRAGEVCGVMARTSVGKTLVLCHLARIAADDAHGHVLFSLEMPAAQIVARIVRAEQNLSRHTLTWQMANGRLDRDAYGSRFGGLRLIDTPALDIPRMTQLVRTIQRRIPVALVSIDYLGLIGGDRRLSTYDRVSHQARDLKEMAKRLGVVVVVLIQVNRGQGQDGSERLTLSAVRDSGVVEEALDYLVALRRLDHAARLSVADREKYRDVIWAEVVKNRHGQLTTREVAIRVNSSSLALAEDETFEMEERVSKGAKPVQL